MRKKDWAISIAILFLLACGVIAFQLNTGKWLAMFRADYLVYASIAISLLFGATTAFVPVRSDGPALVYVAAMIVGFVLSYYGIIYTMLMFAFATAFGAYLTRWLSYRLKGER